MRSGFVAAGTWLALSFGPCASALDDAGRTLRNADTPAEAKAALDDLAREGKTEEAIRRGFCAVVTETVNDPANAPPDAAGWGELIASEAQQQAFGASLDAVSEKAEEFAAAAELGSYNPQVGVRYAQACRLFSFP